MTQVTDVAVGDDYCKQAYPCGKSFLQLLLEFCRRTKTGSTIYVAHKYRGSRYSFGYPACPNLEDQTRLFALFDPDETIGVHRMTGLLLEPGQSTSAIVVHHPAAKYFAA